MNKVVELQNNVEKEKNKKMKNSIKKHLPYFAVFVLLLTSAAFAIKSAIDALSLL